MNQAHPRGHAVRLMDSTDEIRYVIQRATTDLGREIVFGQQPEKAGMNNLLEIYQLLPGLSRQEIEARFVGMGYGQFKQDVAQVVIGVLRPIRQRDLDLTADPGELKRILALGARRQSPSPSWRKSSKKSGW